MGLARAVHRRRGADNPVAAEPHDGVSVLHPVLFAGSKAVLGTILLVVLILILIGALPTWGYSSGWGYGPSGILGVIVIVLLILVLMGRI
jgi:hypothetical protein